MGKSANDHAEILSAVVTSNDNISKKVLAFSGTSDNKPRVAIGIDRYLKVSCSVHFLCHTPSLSVNSSVCSGSFSFVLGQINIISTYFNQRAKVSTKLVKLQCLQFYVNIISRLTKSSTRGGTQTACT